MTTSTPPQENTELEHLKNNFENYLVGLGRHGPEPLQEILKFDNWKHFAKLERERRQRRFFENIDDDTLIALANGDINLHQSVKSVLDQDVNVSL